MQDQIGIPACFSSGEKNIDEDHHHLHHLHLHQNPSAITRSGQNVFMSVYRTKLADQCRSIAVAWFKNLLIHGLSVSIQGPEGDTQYTCRVEVKKPWCFWKKQGSKRFLVDNAKPVHVFWDLKAARFNGDVEPTSDYYVAIVCDDEVVLLLGNLKKEAYMRTGCRPALIDPVLVSRKEHIFGKRKFLTRVKFHDKGSFHDVSIECKNRGCTDAKIDPEMEIRIDGHLAIHVKHLQWKFRGNECIRFKKARIEVYWDVHDWLFSPGLRHALFIFKPSAVSSSSSPTASSSNSTDAGSPEFCLFLYAWKVE
ncbi:uncharacterized protein LOC127246163 [Andrographis paniculata]|uniref:uncharacterized protein LOC127246163 n=1 Tax=Andrographis paniculata TaxID=175694 RepID=UPI0021E9A770|nr:uncharacterized protein LOC127246163 [Andrographis paniculata]